MLSWHRPQRPSYTIRSNLLFFLASSRFSANNFLLPNTLFLIHSVNVVLLCIRCASHISMSMQLSPECILTRNSSTPSANHATSDFLAKKNHEENKLFSFLTSFCSVVFFFQPRIAISSELPRQGKYRTNMYVRVRIKRAYMGRLKQFRKSWLTCKTTYLRSSGSWMLLSWVSLVASCASCL